MTREHIPPRSAGNDQDIGVLHRAQKANVEDLRRWPDGHTVDTLCGPCNQRPGSGAWNYVRTYVKWHDAVVAAARRSYKQTRRDPFACTYAMEFDAPHTLQPARFARQVLGMFLAVQERETLFAEHPTVRSAVAPGDDPRGKPPDVVPALQGCRLGVTIYNERIMYNHGPVMLVEVPTGPQGLVLPHGASGRTDDLYTLGLPPFMFMLTTHPTLFLGKDISGWPSRSTHDGLGRQERQMELPTFWQLPSLVRAMLLSEES